MPPETPGSPGQDRVTDSAALMEALSGLTEAQHEHFLRNAVDAALTYRASGDTDALVRFADGLLASAELRQQVPSYRPAFATAARPVTSAPAGCVHFEDDPDSCTTLCAVPCPTTTPEPHLLGEFPMSCYRCHVEADS